MAACSTWTPLHNAYETQHREEITGVYDLLTSVNTFSSASSCAASLCTYVNAVVGGAGYTLERRVVLSWLDWLDWGCGCSLDREPFSRGPDAEGVGT